MKATLNESPMKPPRNLAQTDLVGTTLGHFRVLAPLGQGGMGVVVRAVDEVLRREVALKVVSPSATGDAECRSRLFREARSAAAVNHPNIATIYEIGEAGDVVYIAMELIRGKTLRQILKQSAMPWEQTIAILRQVLHGLESAHAVGLVHRDLKPDNIMVTDDGLVKVLDFGLAKRWARPAGNLGARDSDPNLELTAEGQIIGTPQYMSPEQVRTQDMDHRSDIFSFGAVLYLMLTDKRAFSGSNQLEVWASVLMETPQPAAELNSSIPVWLSEMAQKCMAKAPQDRYQQVRQLIDELDVVAPILEARSCPPSMLSRQLAPRSSRADSAPVLQPLAPQSSRSLNTGVLVQSGSASAAEGAGETAPSRSRRWKYVSTAAGVALLAGTIAAVALRGPQPAPPAAVERGAFAAGALDIAITPGAAVLPSEPALGTGATAPAGPPREKTAQEKDTDAALTVAPPAAEKDKPGAAAATAGKSDVAAAKSAALSPAAPVVSAAAPTHGLADKPPPPKEPPTPRDTRNSYRPDAL